MARLSIRGDVHTEIKMIPLDALRLDPNNVRFKHLAQPLTDQEIEQLIAGEDDTKALLRSIRASRGLSERPIVSTENLVREGNRRIVCLRKLKAMAHDGKLPELAPDAFDNVECEVLPSDVNAIDVDIYLARAHVKGKKPWARLNQAKHIFELYNNLDQSYDDIRDYLNLGKRTVQTLNWAYRATQDYLHEHSDKGANINQFVYFDQLYKRKALREWVDSNPESLDRFKKWVASGRITDPSRSLARLKDIIENDVAVKALDEQGMADAIKVLEKSHPALSSRTFEAVQKAIDALAQMPLQEYRTLRQDGARLDLLQRLHQEIEEILREAKPGL